MAEYRKAVLDGVYAAMRETFNVPEDDRFMTVTLHDADEFLYGRTYLGIERSDDLVLIQLTVSIQHPHARAEEGAIRRDRQKAWGQSRAAAAGCVRQPGRGREGKLVVRPRIGLIRVS